MTDQRGYIYHQQHMVADNLRLLLTSDAKGWAATPTYFWAVNTGSELGDEGRATVGLQEFRWRRRPDDRYDVLCLSLSIEAPSGFERLSNCESWAIRRMHSRAPERATTTDAELPAIAFLAPNGAVQFVAQIDLKTMEGTDHGL